MLKPAVRAGLQPVTNAAEAEFALVRMHAPFGPVHQGYFFGSRQHEGDWILNPGMSRWWR